MSLSNKWFCPAGQMRSLRLFYSDTDCTRGQVVIASRESQYKILHFHNGGLDKLAQIFEDWSLFAKSKEKVTLKLSLLLVFVLSGSGTVPI